MGLGGPGRIGVDDVLGPRRRPPGPYARLERHDALRPQRPHPIADRRHVTDVVDPHVRGRPAVVLGGLGADAGPGVLLGHPAGLAEPRHPDVLGRVHDHDQRERRAHAVLDQQGDVVHHDGVVGRRRDQLRRPRADAGVQDAVEPRPGLVVGEHDPAERRAVQPALVVEDLLTEGGDDLGQSVGPGFNDLAGDPVGVDDDRAEFRELRRHGRLARPDPTGQSHAQHGAQSARWAPRTPGPVSPGSGHRTHEVAAGGWRTASRTARGARPSGRRARRPPPRTRGTRSVPRSRDGAGRADGRARCDDVPRPCRSPCAP